MKDYGKTRSSICFYLYMKTELNFPPHLKSDFSHVSYPCSFVFLPKFLIMRILLPLFIFTSFLTNAQETYHRKGEMYVYWGWNRGAYSKSDIRFHGDAYDFTLDKVVAKDRPSPFNSKVYFNPSYMTIPQYNLRIGVFLNDKYDISFGADHMKYVMRNYQDVIINGYIQKSQTPYDGTYDNDTINLSPDFLLFEHTDGLNYENIEIRRSDILFAREKFRIETRVGGGVGFLLPRTNTTLLNNPRYDEFHLAGYGMGIMGGVHFSFFKHFFIQFEAKGGFIHMPDIRTTMYKSDRAAQHFFFAQVNGVFGANFNLVKEK